MGKAVPHPLCAQLRELRQALGLSLIDVQKRYGLNAVLVGSYERGDRVPPLTKLDAVLGFYGYRLVAEPIGPESVRRSSDMIAELRGIANQLEKTFDVSAVPGEEPPELRVFVPQELHLSAQAGT